MKMNRKKGFTLMELVVTVAIIGTLAVFAVPAYLDAQQNGKANKALEVMNMIGSAVVNKYTAVAHHGNAQSNSAISSLIATGDWIPLEDNTGIIRYDLAGVSTVIITQQLFKDGVPKSPFGSGWEIRVPSDSTGIANWIGDPPTLQITQHPAFSIRDGSQNDVKAQYTM